LIHFYKSFRLVMGGSQSVEVPGGGTEGYHVLRVQEGSPGQQAGLEAFFDFVVAIGNTRLNQDNDTLKNLLKANIEKEVSMTVYSSKTGTVRELFITPSTLWGGQGLLGVSIRFCSFEGANENVWHILDVSASSPAELAGLREFSDYIIGADSVLHESEDLYSLIEAHEGRPLKLYVYNTETDHCREVTITPNGAWGGEGSLGCGIGYGYLHRIPLGDEEYPLPSAAGDTAPPPSLPRAAAPAVTPLPSAAPAVTPLASAVPTVATPAAGEPLRPDVPIFGTDQSPAAPVSTLTPDTGITDTPTQVIARSPETTAPVPAIAPVAVAPVATVPAVAPVLDPAVMAGMPVPDPAALAASMASMNMAGDSLMTPGLNTSMPALTPNHPVPTPDITNIMTPTMPVLNPAMTMPPATPALPVLNPAVMAGMPPPDPAVLASMNYSLPAAVQPGVQVPLTYNNVPTAQAIFTPSTQPQQQVTSS